MNSHGSLVIIVANLSYQQRTPISPKLATA